MVHNDNSVHSFDIFYRDCSVSALGADGMVTDPDFDAAARMIRDSRASRSDRVVADVSGCVAVAVDSLPDCLAVADPETGAPVFGAAVPEPESDVFADDALLDVAPVKEVDVFAGIVAESEVNVRSVNLADPVAGLASLGPSRSLASSTASARRDGAESTLPRIIGRPSLPLPMTTIFELFDCESSSVASIPRQRR
jgi:hypothetical protein